MTASRSHVSGLVAFGSGTTAVGGGLLPLEKPLIGLFLLSLDTVGTAACSSRYIMQFEYLLWGGVSNFFSLHLLVVALACGSECYYSIFKLGALLVGVRKAPTSDRNHI